MKHIVMIGSPVSHVRSPGILNPMLRAGGHAVDVVAEELAAGRLDAFVARVRRDAGIIGLIVTTPLKQAVCDHLDRRTAIVDLIGATNCVRCDGETWLGANFDGFGFTAALGDAAGPLAGQRVLLVGCGGAGTAIAASLLATADIELLLFDLDADRAAAFATRLGRFAPRSKVRAIAAPVADADIVVNASTAGMRRDDASPIPSTTLTHARVVADIVLGHDTALKREARHLGKVLVAGEAMVDGQVALLMRFFLGKANAEREVLAG